jgi:F0F1-type ATP synthase membrane subunit c/vacuolar-type H+-ATPase subunit K
MLKQVHEHITNELTQGARTDTIFIITAIAFNLIVLGINSGIAGSAADSYNRDSTSEDILLVVFTILLLIVNAISVIGLQVGKQTRNTLLNGLIEMYQDNQVEKYYNPTLLGNYNRRYTLFTGVIACLGITAVIVPLIVRFI